VGAVQETVYWPSAGPGVAARLVGAPGGVALGVAVILATVPLPEALYARTANEYAVPLVSPFIGLGELASEIRPAPGV
jgi:hypothetical protein